MTSYYEMLKDPQWQRKRLEVLEAADWKCHGCGSGEKTLHVHHMYYERGHKPWEYPDNALRSLCEDCHFRVQDEQAEIARKIARLHTTDLRIVHGFVSALTMFLDFKSDPDVSVPFYGDKTGFDMGVSRLLGLHPDNYAEVVRDGRVHLKDALTFRDEATPE